MTPTLIPPPEFALQAEAACDIENKVKTTESGSLGQTLSVLQQSTWEREEKVCFLGRSGDIQILLNWETPKDINKHEVKKRYRPRKTRKDSALCIFVLG